MSDDSNFPDATSSTQAIPANDAGTNVDVDNSPLGKKVDDVGNAIYDGVMSAKDFFHTIMNSHYDVVYNNGIVDTLKKAAQQAGGALQSAGEGLAGMSASGDKLSPQQGTPTPYSDPMTGAQIQGPETGQTREPTLKSLADNASHFKTVDTSDIQQEVKDKAEEWDPKSGKAPTFKQLASMHGLDEDEVKNAWMEASSKKDARGFSDPNALTNFYSKLNELSGSNREHEQELEKQQAIWGGKGKVAEISGNKKLEGVKATNDTKKEIATAGQQNKFNIAQMQELSKDKRNADTIHNLWQMAVKKAGTSRDMTIGKTLDAYVTAGQGVPPHLNQWLTDMLNEAAPQGGTSEGDNTSHGPVQIATPDTSSMTAAGGPQQTILQKGYDNQLHRFQVDASGKILRDLGPVGGQQ
jgi:hypothetical protein